MCTVQLVISAWHFIFKIKVRYGILFFLHTLFKILFMQYVNWRVSQYSVCRELFDCILFDYFDVI